MHQVSSLQLLHHQAPQAAGLILLVSPVFDDAEALLSMLKNAVGSLRRSGPLGEGGGAEELLWVGMVFVSCLLAFLVNLSTFLVIGKTSPVSYQVNHPDGKPRLAKATHAYQAFFNTPAPTPFL